MVWLHCCTNCITYVEMYSTNSVIVLWQFFDRTLLIAFVSYSMENVIASHLKSWGIKMQQAEVKMFQCWRNSRRIKSKTLSNLIFCKTVFGVFFILWVPVWKKSDHPVVFILMCEVYLQFICLSRHSGSVLFPFAALAVINHDRIKLYWAAACTSLLLNSVCGTQSCGRLSVILLTAAV